MTYSPDRGMGAHGVPQKVIEAFQRLADRQRNRPERAMSRVLHHYGGGPLWIVMHVGDLIHRMSQDHAWRDDAGQYEVIDKIEKSLRALRQAYGFRRELDESIANNACSHEDPDDRHHRHGPACAEAIAAYRVKLDALLLDYANEHRKLPVYNEPQKLAQDAAVAMGEQRFEDAAVTLESLLQIAKSDRWVEEATACQLNANREPILYKKRKRYYKEM